MPNGPNVFLQEPWAMVQAQHLSCSRFCCCASYLKWKAQHMESAADLPCKTASALVMDLGLQLWSPTKISNKHNSLQIQEALPLKPHRKYLNVSGSMQTPGGHELPVAPGVVRASSALQPERRFSEIWVSDGFWIFRFWTQIISWLQEDREIHFSAGNCPFRTPFFSIEKSTPFQAKVSPSSASGPVAEWPPAFFLRSKSCSLERMAAWLDRDADPFDGTWRQDFHLTL